MKFIVGLSSLALFSLSSISPCLAANQLVNSSEQSLPSTTKTIQIAQTRRRVNMYQRRKQQSAAAAAARREAERRYFQSLTPEQKRAYIAQRRARQEQQARQMLLMLGILGAAMGGNSGASPSSNANQDRWIVEDSYNRQPAYQSAPTPVAPISPFYGTGPGGSFYGN
ncbi:MAG: hypothetical protein KME31_09515 [Tolypothrix carrinoi HA7290-LM1]|jgi:hypothetical protein|nr:hypothetical protein [Tolypothrix carrinoi HA7290-LM1]